MENRSKNNGSLDGDLKPKPDTEVLICGDINFECLDENSREND
jgi:hypothetical protein